MKGSPAPSLRNIKARAPVIGGNFGVWGGLFRVWDSSIKGIRQKEDPWNAIRAGFMTGGSPAIRGGFKSASNSTIRSAMLRAVIEGVSIGFQGTTAGGTRLELPEMMAEP
ncbi:Mitochondrial import inner membrane translocase subunit tim-17 [Venustampulla echinocandica]|uniref:Mitochondrial import inner membrane translocase subunit tim-17 n=1 Tax=Venustampulla echinocandica TaxID=2656787 RepID=A0A370T9T5_9HELO|nr:Mitochondrial import inner membrane translocase subunit tim-17 [Venustampulla echinocandica]RDL30405.1 Mitochondrial import inner membrane translocase subunit tim-17 [Venustampulla echinocandica]